MDAENPASDGIPDEDAAPCAWSRRPSRFCRTTSWAMPTGWPPCSPTGRLLQRTLAEAEQYANDRPREDGRD